LFFCTIQPLPKALYYLGEPPFGGTRGCLMKRLGSGIAALGLVALAFAAPAGAADLPVAPAYYPPKVFPPPAIYNWTGVYIGGNLGADFLADRITQAGSGTLTGPANSSPVGLIGGGEFGANYQFSTVVVGVEATISATNTSGSGRVPDTTVGSTNSFTSAPRWLATATGRLGFAANDWLFYGKGGAALMHTDYTETLLGPGGGTFASSALNDNRTGFVAGAGIEYALTENWSARAEYDFFDFGSKTYNFASADSPLVIPASIRSNLNELTVGVNYRFTFGGGAPLGARY
jgi:outer membrane immunogenic protein